MSNIKNQKGAKDEILRVASLPQDDHATSNVVVASDAIERGKQFDSQIVSGLSIVKEEITKAIKRVVGVGDMVHLEQPEREEHGDYSSNIAMAIFSQLPTANLKLPTEDIKSPRRLAEEVVKKLSKNKLIAKYISRIEVAGPGFINFWLSSVALLNEILRVSKEKDDYGSSKMGQGKTVVVDYSAPNIAKRFSVGHLRSTIIGQALYNLYGFSGYKTIGDNHLGDWGTQFGMIIAQVVRKELDVEKLSLDDIESLYVEFNNEANDNPEIKKLGSEWFKKLEEGDPQARKIWQECIDLSLKEFQRIWDRLGVKIDFAYGESFYEDKMQAVIDEFREKGISKKSEGAEIVEFSDMAPAILLKSDGGTTYFTRDLATIKFRLEKWNPKIIIYEVGAEQTLHFRQVFEAVEKVGWGSGTVFKHVAHGLFLLEGKKMSTRKGTTIKLEEVLGGAIRRARELVEKSETGGKLSDKEKEEISKAVGIGAVKYFDLMHHPTSEINFNWNLIFNMQGNSGPYLQYTYARTQSVLRKAIGNGHEAIGKEKTGLIPSAHSLLPNPEELSLLRSFPHFSEVIIDAAKNYSPNLLCNYLYGLAQKFNNFYAKHRILSNKEKGISDKERFRIALTRATGQILKNGLTLLGIKTPEKM